MGRHFICVAGNSKLNSNTMSVLFCCTWLLCSCVLQVEIWSVSRFFLHSLSSSLSLWLCSDWCLHLLLPNTPTCSTVCLWNIDTPYTHLSTELIGWHISFWLNSISKTGLEWTTLKPFFFFFHILLLPFLVVECNSENLKPYSRNFVRLKFLSHLSPALLIINWCVCVCISLCSIIIVFVYKDFAYRTHPFVCSWSDEISCRWLQTHL